MHKAGDVREELWLTRLSNEEDAVCMIGCILWFANREEITCEY